jgi:uncharacterized protein (TIGR02453 family)
MASGFPGFPPATRRFLRQLARNNNREWFQGQKQVYETEVKEPMVQLVSALGGPLLILAPELVVDPNRAIYRIYRDTRFSPDKTPYKSHLAAIFAPRGLPKHAGAGMYFEISPDGILVAGGVYMPGSAELAAIRSHIAAHDEELRKIISGRQFKREFGGMEGEKLVRAPKDFAPDHPAIDLLRYKQFLVSVAEPAKLAESPRLFSRLLTLFAAMTPLVRFLNAPLVTAVAPSAPKFTEHFPR